jgi:hypothetical protein
MTIRRFGCLREFFLTDYGTNFVIGGKALELNSIDGALGRLKASLEEDLEGNLPTILGSWQIRYRRI